MTNDIKANTKSIIKFNETIKNRVDGGIALYDGDLKIDDGSVFLPLFMIEYMERCRLKQRTIPFDERLAPIVTYLSFL